MDAVELNYHRVTVVPELFVSGRDRVSVVEAAAVELSGALLCEKDAITSAKTLESKSTQLEKVPAPELFRHPNHGPSSPSEDVSKQFHFGSAKVPSWFPRHEEVRGHRKVGQVSRSGSGSSKRQRIIEDATDPAVTDGIKETSSKLVSHPTKCESNGKQRNKLSSKRSEKRNCKIPMKTKHDSFSLKASLASFNSVAAGNNSFGLYGLKTDIHDNDITKLIDDLSLDDLLHGTYEHPNLGKGKGKKPTNTTDNILCSVGKACSILQLHMSTQQQNLSEMDSCPSEKLSTYQSSSISVAGTGDQEESSATDLSVPSSNMDTCSKAESSANLLNFSFKQPKDTLKLLALPPPKDLEALLSDATKPAISSRNGTDARSGKQASRSPSLPLFPWSQTFNGNCRANFDAVKLVTSRSTCQGRWVKVASTSNSPGTAPKCYTDLESLSYDDNLVPSYGQKTADNKTLVPSISANFMVPCAFGSSSMKESGRDLDNHEKVEQCPRLLAAAQTLCDIASSASTLNQDGLMKWPKKPSQKTTKARKSKSTEKPDGMLPPSTLITGSEQTARSSADHTSTSKRPKLSTINNRKDLLHINGMRKGPVNWSTPKSSRSSPNKSAREPAYTVKQSNIMPPPSKVVNRACNGRQKFRELLRIDWKRDRQD